MSGSIPLAEQIFDDSTITICHNLGSKILVEQWPINHNPERTDLPNEPERVSVKKNNVSYSLVLDNDNPRIEIWTVDSEGEIAAMFANISLPRKGSTDRTE